MSRTLIPTMDVRILEEIVAPDEPTMNAPVARAVASLALTEDQTSEIHRLLDKHNAGLLSARQRAKLEGYVRVGNFLNLLRAKARASLSHKTCFFAKTTSG
jgi:hypothetical protein